MKIKSTEISSYFKENIGTGEKENTGEQQRRSTEEEEDDGVEEKTEKHTQPASITEAEVRQDSTKAVVRPVSGPTGEIMTVWP